MSIVFSLRKLVDPNRARVENAEQRTERERPRDEGEGGKPPPTLVCKACGYEGTDPSFCPRCLADTMRPMGRRRGR